MQALPPFLQQCPLGDLLFVEEEAPDLIFLNAVRTAYISVAPSRREQNGSPYASGCLMLSAGTIFMRLAMRRTQRYYQRINGHRSHGGILREYKYYPHSSSDVSK